MGAMSWGDDAAFVPGGIIVFIVMVALLWFAPRVSDRFWDYVSHCITGVAFAIPALFVAMVLKLPGLYILACVLAAAFLGSIWSYRRNA
ncbi:hypothetical protein ELZ19_09590 [Brucella abortus]|uniref:hypothetical protein n=1 Tax=Brucella abortus TaxID=235 RepID=UPI0004E97D17|nr:hypothetical protein [Brucella abortus]KFH18560.1 hypothetical protein IB60_16315 [Brucella abortus LMN1]KFH24275.1 hypothetical protein IB61_11460 [Brucella abortus LMN2]RUQ67021.1 hypothetical protein ELZ23_15725 [Brucella abortus]RUQ78324.1 hypothetical protein ELZ22_17185 [Brucella abortus]RUQ88127.1 hypothetical protein ELZ18_15810 [Brucella abortus]